MNFYAKPKLVIGGKVKRKKAKNPEGLYESFHGAAPICIRRIKYQPPKKGEILLKVGRITQINYQPEHPSKRKSIEFYHRSGDTGSKMLLHKPILAVSKDGKRFYLIPDKNKAKFTSRGIVG